MLKILICPDSFKESLSAEEVASCIAKGLLKANNKFNITKIPIADGGEGTLDIILNSTKNKRVYVTTRDPLGKKIQSYYGIIDNDKTAVIEMAKTSGLTLVPVDKRNPLKTTTYGTGELIRDALNKGYKKIVVTIGGSATVDAGLGMAQALGVKFYDRNNKLVGWAGENLVDIKRIDFSGLHPKINDTEFVVAADVKSSLYGKTGAAYVYGPQKGATLKIVKILDNGLRNLANILWKQHKIDVRKIKSGGAAGGLGAGLVSFCNAKIVSGVDLVIKITQLEKHVRDSDLVITGEGKIDNQTLYGKTISGVLKLARKYNKPVICFTGCVGENIEKLYISGVNSIFSIINHPMSIDCAIHNAKHLLQKSAENVGRVLLIKLGMSYWRH